MIQASISKSPLLQINFKRQFFQAVNFGSILNKKHIISDDNKSLTGTISASNISLEKISRQCLKVARQNMSASTSGQATVHTNRLMYEKSPYLLQHAHNPVDWYPWGEEAFNTSKSQNKPIFLSVGYSTCHWCHVMERESFESEDVAEVMNSNFVCIKVDREERPDVDRIYMSYVQRTTGSGGWPMSVFLTPDLEPLFGGTYFPPDDHMGRIGFKSLCELIGKQWEKEHRNLHKEAKASVTQLKKLTSQKFVRNAKVPDSSTWKKCMQQLSRSYEPLFGGFSHAPKFPQPSMINFLFHVYSKNKKSEDGKRALDMCLTTLRHMALGGIHDHVNCGFARYSVDEKWHLPHFEKMLYDNSQLAVAYVNAYVVTRDMFFAEIVDDILTYVGRDLSHPEGGFFGAEDADSYPTEGAPEKKEGAFCVWEMQEVKNLLRDTTKNVSDFDLYTFHFNIKEGGNVPSQYDHHHELTRKNVLSCFGSYETTAAEFEISVDDVKGILKKCNQILYTERQKRPKPHVDTKIVTAWNGLMISGFAKAGFALKNSEYTNRAIKAANFIRKYLYIDNRLYRCCYPDEDGKITQTVVPILGFMDDYAFLIRGLIDLYEATLDSSWLQWAEILQEQQNAIFWDAQGHGYFSSSSDDKAIIVRDKEDQDGAEPCGNSVSVHNLLKLYAYLQRTDYHENAEQILAAFSDRLVQIPVALPEMSSALISYHTTPTQVFIAGKTDDNNTQALLDVVRSRFQPGRILALADGPGGRAGLLYNRHESLAKLKPVQGKSAAYVCRNFACSLPVTEPEDLATSLDADS